MSHLPIIGLTPLWNETIQRLCIDRKYSDAITSVGGVPIVLPFTENEDVIEKMASLIDGLFLTGGQDINPELYHEEVTEFCGNICKERDDFEFKLVQKVMEKNKPIFGVCRGIQLLNVFFNGTLIQDIETEYKRERNFSHKQQEPYDHPVHQVFLIDGTPLDQWLNIDVLDVNSRHHQAIHQLGEELMADAISSDGLIEAIHHQNYPFLVAVQWHPEAMYKVDEKERVLFERFVESCKKNCLNE
ncbi:MAG: gamma-glutamyl-gamma-aminobutyrate hydrolase family protein [Turicibacter sp.]|nr:gamma-glutamyl-gamma-aminobutyrate hydrolase family protein [Turicibacter sp.]